MDKNRILEIAFNTVKESTDWGMSSEDKNYGYYISGVTDIADKLLEELDKKNCKAEG